MIKFVHVVYLEDLFSKMPMSKKYYETNKENLKQKRKRFDLKLEMDKKQEERLHTVIRKINQVKTDLHLCRGSAPAVNLKLMEKLLHCWFAVHGGCSASVSVESAAAQHQLVKAYDQNRAAGTAKASNDESHAKGPRPDFAIPGVSSTSSSDLQVLDNVSEQGIRSVQDACPTIPVELLVQPKQQLHVACNQDDKIYLVCKSSLEKLVSHVTGKGKKCKCGSDWEADTLSIKCCTANNHVCSLQMQCSHPSAKHMWQWHSSAIVGNKYYVNLR